MTESPTASTMARRRWHLHWLGKALQAIRDLDERGYLDDEAREAIAAEMEKEGTALSNSNARTIPWEREVRIRTALAARPLAERQRAAEAMGWPDGLPLTEDEIRNVIRAMRATDSSISRDQVRDLMVPLRPEDGRIGGLNTEELLAILNEEWPVSQESA